MHPQLLCELYRCNVLRIGKVALDFVQLNFVIECHQVHAVLGGILDERSLFARIGVDDTRRSDFQIKNLLYLTLTTQTLSN